MQTTNVHRCTCPANKSGPLTAVFSCAWHWDYNEPSEKKKLLNNWVKVPPVWVFTHSVQLQVPWRPWTFGGLKMPWLSAAPADTGYKVWLDTSGDVEHLITTFACACLVIPHSSSRCVGPRSTTECRNIFSVERSCCGILGAGGDGAWACKHSHVVLKSTWKSHSAVPWIDLLWLLRVKPQSSPAGVKNLILFLQSQLPEPPVI